MLYITYQNENGRLDFNGGSGSRPWRILEADGLGLAGKSFNTASYPSGVGQKTLSETVGARSITIQCDVSSISGYDGVTRNNRWEISKALKILNLPGKLLIRDGQRTRKIDARCTEAVQGTRHGGYTVFAMQFVCDYPYFEDRETKTIPIFKIENLIGVGMRWYLDGDGILRKVPIAEGTFTLPCIFSCRTSEASILNIGDVDAEPIIRITVQGEVKTGDEAGVLIIKNETTEQQLELLCDAKDGDVITINIPERKIYRQKTENLISYLSPSSFLSDFWLAKGENRISVINNVSMSCIVECEFSNKYLEAVI